MFACFRLSFCLSVFVRLSAFFFDFLDQLCPKWIKLDQIGFSPIVALKYCHHCQIRIWFNSILFGIQIKNQIAKFSTTWPKFFYNKPIFFPCTAILFYHPGYLGAQVYGRTLLDVVQVVWIWPTKTKRHWFSNFPGQWWQ